LLNLSLEEQKTLLAKKLANDNFIDYCVIVDKNYEVSWHHRVIAEALQETYEKITRNERVRIILELPPRHGKSDETSIKFPSWVLGKDPSLPIILASYSQDLATDFGQSTRDLMNSQNYQAVFNTRLRADSQAKSRWLTESKGGYTAVGIGGPVTGRGFKLGIIDDPLKNRQDADSEVIRESQWKWYKSTFLTREEGNGALIVIATRWHDDDLIGKILKDAEANGRLDEWIIIKLPAIAEEDEENRKKGEALWPAKYPLEILERRKEDLGPYEFSALYQQNPVDEASREFKEQWFHSRPMAEVLKLSTRNFVTIDPAYALRGKSDNIGITINFVDKENNWNFKSFGVKVNPKELINLMFKIHDDYNPECFGIEEGAYDTVIKPFLADEMKKRNKFLTVKTLKHNQQAKELRIRGLIPRYSSGSIFHIEGECNDLELELARFPKGVHDDVCLVGDTLVSTIKGDVKIKDIKVGNRVITPSGIKKVLWSGSTGRQEVISNVGLTGTPGHRVFNGNSFDKLDSIAYNVSIFSFKNQLIWKYKQLLYSMERNTDLWEGRESIILVNQIQIKEEKILKDFTLQFGSFITKRQFKKATVFITKMVIHLTMILVIWSAWKLGNIYQSIIRGIWKTQSLLKGTSNISIELDHSQKNGINQKKERNGIVNIQRSHCLRKYSAKYAQNVMQDLKPGQVIQGSVVENVIVDSIQENGERTTQTIIREVYNIKVEDDGVYYANRILVSNCDATAYQLQLAEAPDTRKAYKQPKYESPFESQT